MYIEFDVIISFVSNIQVSVSLARVMDILMSAIQRLVFAE